MSSLADKFRRQSSGPWLRWFLGLSFTLLALFFLSRMVDWKHFVTLLGSVPLGILLLTVALYLVSVLLRSFAWQLLLQRKATLYHTFITLNEGYFFNNIFPLRIGELARAVLMGRRTRQGVFSVLLTIVVERSYDLVIAAGLFLATLPLAFSLAWAEPAALLLLLVVGAGLFILYLAARRREWVEEKVASIGMRRQWVKRWVLPQIRSLMQGFSVLIRIEYFLGSLALIFAAWILAIVRDWVLIGTLVSDAPLWWAALGASAANIAGAIPSVMGALGTYELGGTGALTLVGMPGEAALAYLLIVHMIHLVISTCIGAFGLSREGQTLASLYTDIHRTERVG